MTTVQIKLPLTIQLTDLQQAIRNEEDAGFILQELSVDKNVQNNTFTVALGGLPMPDIQLQDLKVTTLADAKVKAQELLDSLPDDGGVVAYGEMMLGGTATWVAAYRTSGMAVEQAGVTPTLPDFAQDLLSTKQGVPWALTTPLPKADGYLGLVPGSFRVFKGLGGLPGGGTTALYYECKLDIDNDGSGGNTAGDPAHQGRTTLRDANNISLNASRDAFAVIPLDAAEAAKDPELPAKKKGLPDFGKDLGLKVGDLGVALWRQQTTGTVRWAFFVYGDKGPPNKLGEGSVHMADLLGIPSDPNKGGLDAKQVRDLKKGVVHIAFPGSGAPFLTSSISSRLIPEQITPAAQAQFKAFCQQPAPTAAPPAAGQ